MIKVVTCLPYLNIDHEGTCKACARGNNIRNPFPKSETKTKGTLELIHSNVCGPMPSTSLVHMNIMPHLLMTIQERQGYISWRPRVRCLGN